MGKKVSEMTPAERAAKNKRSAIYNAKVSSEKANNRIITYRIFGRDISLPKGFTFGAGVRLGQNKTSVEEGFKKLQQWLKNPTADNWSKLFGSNNQFGMQLRNYLAEGNRAPFLKKDIKGEAASKKLFDALKVKELIKPEDITTIKTVTDDLGNAARIKARESKTFIPMSENEKTIRNFSNGENWLKANPDSTKTIDGQNVWRMKANRIRQILKQQEKIGGFPPGVSNERKLWASLYRASKRGDRIKIVGEFADGKLPVDKDLNKVKWTSVNEAGVPAWKRVKFKDIEAPGNPTFTFGKDGSFAKQIDKTFGEGFFKQSTDAYNTQQAMGAEKVDGQSLKEIFRRKILINELVTLPLETKEGRTKWKVAEIPTPEEVDNYLKAKLKGFTMSEVHHPYGVGKDPYTTESALRAANRAMGYAETKFKNSGDMDSFRTEIERINKDIGGIRSNVDGAMVGKQATSGEQIFNESLKFTSKADQPGLRKLLIEQGERGGTICGLVGFKSKGGRMMFAKGTGCGEEVAKAFDEEPLRFSDEVTKLPYEEGPLNKVKNFASKFLSVAKKGGKFAAFAGVGAATAGLVKEFRNDDPSTYLSNENQQKNMLIDMMTQPILGPSLDAPSTAFGDAQLPAIGAVTAAGMVPGGAELYRQRTGAGSMKRPLGGPRLDAEGAKILKNRVSPFRAALGPLSGVLGKGLAATGTPLGMLALEPLYIGQQIADGDSAGEIATNPLNYLGPAFAGSLSKEATRFAGPKMSSIMRLGISPTALKTVSRRFGLPGLGLSAGISAYEMYQNKKAGRGLFDDG